MAPLILRLMGLPKLSTMDGVAPQAMLDPEVFGEQEQPSCPVEDLRFEAGEHAFSEEDKDTITRDLEALGYL